MHSSFFKLSITICLVCIAQFVAYAKTFQVWQQDSVSYKMSASMSAEFQYEARINVVDNYKLMENHFTPSIAWQVNDWLSISPNYRYVLLKKDHHFIKDHRPGMDFTFSHTIDNFKFSNRSRFIARKTESKSPYLRYRNMSKIQYLGSQLCQPYISYELFFDDGSHDNLYKKSDKLSSHWLSIGAARRFSTNLSFGLAYMLILNKDIGDEGFKKPCNVICVSMNLMF